VSRSVAGAVVAAELPDAQRAPGRPFAAACPPADVIIVDRAAPLKAAADLQPLLARARAEGVPVKPLAWLTGALLEARLPEPLAAAPGRPPETPGDPAAPARTPAPRAGAVASQSSGSFVARRRSARLSDTGVGAGPDGAAAGLGSWSGTARARGAPLHGAPAGGAAGAGLEVRGTLPDARPAGSPGAAGPGAAAVEAVQWLGEPLAAPPPSAGLAATQHRRYYGGFVRVRAPAPDAGALTGRTRQCGTAALHAAPAGLILSVHGLCRLDGASRSASGLREGAPTRRAQGGACNAQQSMRRVRVGGCDAACGKAGASIAPGLAVAGPVCLIAS